MIRALSVATLAAAGLAMPAVAGETNVNDTAAVSAHSAELADAQTAKQAQRILAGQGYINISALNRGENGRWTGTAQKDGKSIFVAVVLPSPKTVAATN